MNLMVCFVDMMCKFMVVNKVQPNLFLSNLITLSKQSCQLCKYDCTCKSINFMFSKTKICGVNTQCLCGVLVFLLSSLFPSLLVRKVNLKNLKCLFQDKHQLEFKESTGCSGVSDAIDDIYLDTMIQEYHYALKHLVLSPPFISCGNQPKQFYLLLKSIAVVNCNLHL